MHAPKSLGLALLLPLLLVSVVASGQTEPATATSPGARDTIVIVQRDTVVVLQRDTVLYQVVEPAQRPPSSSPAPTRTTSAREAANEAAIDRRRVLREQRIREYEEWLAAQPNNRPNGISRAYKLYLSELLAGDFPALTAAIEQTYDGRYGLEGKLGVLTRPSDINALFDGRAFRDEGFDPGTARFGLRGFTAGLEGRVYMSQAYRRFPFYLGFGLEYSLAPINVELWTRSADATFQQLREVPVNAQDFSFSFVSGWQLRTPNGLVLDLAPGLRGGIKSLRSSNAQVSDALTQRYWNLLNGTSTPYLALVLRVGFGKGTWLPGTAPNAQDKPSPKRSRSKRRGRRRR